MGLIKSWFKGMVILTIVLVWAGMAHYIFFETIYGNYAAGLSVLLFVGLVSVVATMVGEAWG